MSDRLTVRPARPGEIDEVGRLTVRAYVDDGTVSPVGVYATELGDASRRARPERDWYPVPDLLLLAFGCRVLQLS